MMLTLDRIEKKPTWNEYAKKNARNNKMTIKSL